MSLHPYLTKDKISSIFHVGVWWNIIYGFFNLTVGIFIISFTDGGVYSLFYKIMRHEILEDPGDLIINLIGPLLNNISIKTSVFIGFYLIFWGFMEIFLSINILKNRLWAYPTFLYLIGLFTIYEIYRVLHTHSIILSLIIIIDIFILWIINREYKIVKQDIQDQNSNEIN